MNFAEKCSGTKTVDYSHTMNWVDRVYGASYLDYSENRPYLEKIYQVHRMQRANSTRNKSDLCKFISSPLLELPTNDFTHLAALMYGEIYVKYLMAGIGKCDGIQYATNLNFISQVFMNSSSVIFFAFTFSREVNLNV